jgi:hypothetical protein
MADLSYQFSDLYSQVSDFLGTGSSPTGTPLTDAKAIVNRAYRRYVWPADMRTGKLHVWSWLKQPKTLQTESSKWKYALPTDFSRMVDYPVFDDSKGYEPLNKVSREQLMQARVDSISSGYPWCFAVVPAMPSIKLPSSWEMWLYPNPDGAYLLKFVYLVRPQKLENATDYPLTGGPEGGEALMEMCIAVAEQQEDDAPGPHTEIATGLLQDLVRNDTGDASDSLGRLSQNVSLSERLAAGRDLMTETIEANVYADER